MNYNVFIFSFVSLITNQA